MPQHKPAKKQRAPSAQMHRPAPTQGGLSHATVQRALTNLRALSPNDILQLQRTIGNQAVQRVLQQESQDGFEADSNFERQLSRTKGSGKPLPQKTKDEFEQSLGADLSNVRIHANATSPQLNRSIQAKAFTHGNDIHFDAGEFNPTTAQGKHLLAHELTHTIQQTGGRPANRVQTKLHIGAANDRYEQEADRVAQSVSSGRSGMVSNIQPTTSPGVQRMLKFKPEDLQGNLSTKSKRAGKIGIHSTYSRLQTMLNHYWASHGDLNQQYKLLLRMDKLSAKWLKEHKSSYNKNNNNDKLKYASVARLSTEINTEIAKTREKMESRAFMEKFDKESDIGKSYLDDVPSAEAVVDPLAAGKQVSYNRRHNVPHAEWTGLMSMSNGYGGIKKQIVPTDYQDPDKARQMGEDYEQKEYDQYIAQKKLGFTPAHRAALRAYTGEAYLHINPAMDNNVEWMKSIVESRNPNGKKHEDAAYLKRAIEVHRETGAMVNSALNKLPPWKQTQTIYRGESITVEEANRIKVGSDKHYSHLVSTSLKLDTPQSQVHKFKNHKRPWGIIYHITDSTTGRDIDSLSKAKGELEILFPSNTNFRVTKILKTDPVTKDIEVEVKQI